MPAILRRNLIVLSLFLQASFPFAISSQQPQTSSTAQVMQLTLKDTVLLAMKQNPQRIIAQLLVSQSDHDLKIARSALLPQADLAADGSIHQYNLQTVERSPRVAAGPYQFIEAGPTFSQTLLNFPLVRSYQISQEGRREARADEQTTREIVVNAVVNQYLLVLQAFATRDAAQARVALAQRLYDQASELQKTGVGLKIDTVRANVELQNERQNLIDADAATRTTRYNLAELLDLPRDQELDVMDRLEFYQLPEVEQSALLDQALANRPEIRSFNSQQRIAKLSADAAREQRLPQLGFTGFWAYQGEHFNNGIPAYAYIVSMDFPLFTSGRIRAQVANAKLEEQRVAENRRALEDRIVREVKVALEDLHAARSAVDVANLGLQLAQEEVAQAERRFAAGVTTNIEVITAQDNLARANDNQIDALYRFNVSRAALSRATGDIESTYSK